VRQRDALAFNIALEWATRKAGIDRNGTIHNKSIQIVAYADYIDIMGRAPEIVEPTFTNFERTAQEMGLI
jgi:hypothetical protein